MKDYSEAINWLLSYVPSYQDLGSPAFKGGLGTITEFCNHLNNPQKEFKSIHIAGTNGKGSTAHLLSSVLQEAGYKVGLYTSPHLLDFRERIKINGTFIERAFIFEFITDNKEFIKSKNASFFEICVALSFAYFKYKKVDIAIIEVGLGGRLDATNILKPLASVITNISLDHTDLLGHSIKEIALEKAGIIKPNTPVIIGNKNNESFSVFKKIAKKNDADLHIAEQVEFRTDLQGNYQSKNLATAYKVLEVLADLKFKLNYNQIEKGFLNVKENTNFLGRWEILNKEPLTILDTAHNKAGITECIRQLQSLQTERLIFVLGFVKGKDWDSILKIIPNDAILFFTEFTNQRSWNIFELKEHLSLLKQETYFVKNPIEALRSAQTIASKKDIVFCGGSNFLISDIIS